MSLQKIQEQVKVILSAVTGVGIVHDYIRWATDRVKFMALFGHTDGAGKKRVNAWMITRDKTPSEVASNTHDLRSHNFRIVGVYGHNDADESEVMFQQIIEDICTAFRTKYQLNGTANNTEPVQVEMVEYRTFAGMLCHYCELTLQADEYENWS